MEAFSDGVLAIIITIMVLKLKAPSGISLVSLREIAPIFTAYVLSYVYVGIYWTNHHHLVSAVKYVKGKILWRNLHWLFWMSLIPVVTEWTGLNLFSKTPTVVYGVILLMCAISYNMLQGAIIKTVGRESNLAKSIGKDIKGKLSILFYALGILFSMVFPIVGYLLYFAIAVWWIVPDVRIEKYFEELKKI